MTNALPVSLLQDEPRDRLLGSNDVHSVPSLVPRRRGPAARTRHRYLPRAGAVLVKPLPPGICPGDLEATGRENTFKSLATAPGRGFRTDPRQERTV